MIETVAMTCCMNGSRFTGGVTLPWLNRWSLSAWQARVVFPNHRLLLNTDARGEALLIGALGLPFDEVVTDDLPAIPHCMGWLWSLPKLFTYRLLSAAGRAFLHLDYDFKFWRRPSARIMEAAAFAQFVTDCPDDQWSLNRGMGSRGLPAATLTCNAGILGGNDAAGLCAAAGAGIAVGLNPRNMKPLRAASIADDWLPGSLIEETAIASHFGEAMTPLLPIDATHAQWDAAGCAHEANSKTDMGSAAHNEFRLFTEHPIQWRRTRNAWLSQPVDTTQT